MKQAGVALAIQPWPTQSLLFGAFSSVILACFPNKGQTVSPPEATAAEGNAIKDEFVSGHDVWTKSLGALAAK